MNRRILLLSVLGGIAALSPPVFAEQTIDPSGALDPTGVLEGVDMINQGGGGTLTVGDQDIFTNNSGGPFVGISAVSTNVNSTSNIVFNGSSTVFGDIGAAAGPLNFLDINAGANSEIVTFLGSVFGTTLDITGTGTVNFNGGALSTNVTALDLDGDGTLSIAQDTLVTGALTNNTMQTGTLLLTSGSQLTGAVGGIVGLRTVNVVGGSNTAGVSATITGLTNSFAFSLGTNTLNIGDALTLANGGTGGVINTTIFSSTVFGNIVATGAVSLGPSLDLIVTVPGTSLLMPGAVFNIVQGPGAGGSVVTVTSTNPLFTFSPVPPGGTTGGFLTIQLTGVPLQAAPQSVVNVLLNGPLTPDLSNILTAINAQSTPAAVSNAVAQLVPSTPALVAPLVAFQRTREFQGLWLSRMNVCMQDGPQDRKNLDETESACQGDDLHQRWWINSFGHWEDQGTRRAFPGYDSRIMGTMLAYDAPLNRSTRAGLGLGYAKSAIDGDVFDTDSHIDTYLAMGYLGHENGPWFVQGSAAVSWNEYSQERGVNFANVSRAADADYSGQDYTAFLRTGFDLAGLRNKLTPIVSLQYTRVNLDDYSERHAGDLNLEVDDQGYNFLQAGVGGKLEHYFDSGLTAELHANWFHQLLNEDLAQVSGFRIAGAPSFRTKGLKPERNTPHCCIPLRGFWHERFQETVEG